MTGDAPDDDDYDLFHEILFRSLRTSPIDRAQGWPRPKSSLLKRYPN